MLSIFTCPILIKLLRPRNTSNILRLCCGEFLSIWPHTVTCLYQSLPLLQFTTYTANIYSQFTVIGCVTFHTVIWQWLSQPTAVPMTLSEFSIHYDLKRALLSNTNQKCNLFFLFFFLIVAFLVNSPGRNKRRQVCKNKFWMSVAKSLEGQERKKIGHEEQLELYYYKRVTTKVIQFIGFPVEKSTLPFQLLMAYECPTCNSCSCVKKWH